MDAYALNLTSLGFSRHNLLMEIKKHRRSISRIKTMIITLLASLNLQFIVYSHGDMMSTRKKQS